MLILQNITYFCIRFHFTSFIKKLNQYTIMDIISRIIERAKANKQRIVLPEGTEERTLKAANQILTDEVAELILLGNPEEIMDLAKKWGLGNINKATIIDPENHPKMEEYAELLFELRKKKGNDN